MPTKVHLVKATVFPVVMYGCESWTIKKAEHWRTVVLEETLERSFAGSQREELRPWQRSWGRRFCIRNGGIEPQEFPWKFSSIYPQNQSLSTFCFVLSPTSDFTGGCPPLPLSEKRVNLQLIKFLGVTRVFKLSKHRFLWAVKRLIRNCIGEGIFTCWPMFAAKFPYPLPAVSLAVYWLI